MSTREPRAGDLAGSLRQRPNKLNAGGRQDRGKRITLAVAVPAEEPQAVKMRAKPYNERDQND
jgi:hypothetical protein